MHCTGAPMGVWVPWARAWRQNGRLAPSRRAGKAAVEFNRLALAGPIPARGVKYRGAALVGDDEIIAGLDGGLYAVPGQKLTVGSQQYLLSRSRADGF